MSYHELLVPTTNEQFASFNVVKQFVFPVWLAIVPPIFLFLEIQKQFTRVSRRQVTVG